MTAHAIHTLWTRFWMRYAGTGAGGRMALRLAARFAPPYKGRRYLAQMNRNGYVSPLATIPAEDISLGDHVFIGDRVIVYRQPGGGSIAIGSGSSLYNDTIIEVGAGGSIAIGSDTHIQPRCQFSAYCGSITIGSGVQIAPNCSFYPYNHGFAAGIPVKEQPLTSCGGIVVEDGAWLGVGVIVLDNVRIGSGAVIGAGSVVTRDVPEDAIALGSPARVVGMRDAACCDAGGCRR